MKGNIYLYIICCLLLSYSGITLVTGAKMQQYLEGSIQTTNIKLQYSDAVKEFYEISSYRFFWMQLENEANRNLLLTILKNAGEQGLEEKDYQHQFIEAFRNKTLSLDNMEDSIAAEIKFTDAAIHFFSNLAFGQKRK